MVLTSAAIAQPAKAGAADATTAACARLSQVAQSLQLAGPGTAGRYRCDLQQRTASGQVLALRYQGPQVPDGTSNLVGYFEVERASQAVHPWDLAEGRRAAKPLPAGSVPAPTVMVCGLAFELPVAYRITPPRRSEGPRGMRLCSFQVVRDGSSTTPLECKDKEEGGSPPYQVCDWALGGVADWPTVQVARTRIDTDRQPIEPFDVDDGAWRLPNAYGATEALERVRFFDKRAYRGEVVTRASWYRTRVKKYEPIDAGAASVEAVLLQLTPQLAVVLVDPPTDTSAGQEPGCRVFCGSLRAAGRRSDEP